MSVIDPEGEEARVLDALVDLSDCELLEIGAGDGRLTLRLAERARSVLALEPLERQVLRARKRMTPGMRRGVRFEIADATAYRYPRNKFDVGVLSYSL